MPAHRPRPSPAWRGYVDGLRAITAMTEAKPSGGTPTATMTVPASAITHMFLAQWINVLHEKRLRPDTVRQSAWRGQKRPKAAPLPNRVRAGVPSLIIYPRVLHGM
ncbi:unnamed protein product [Urochloa humidicola]